MANISPQDCAHASVEPRLRMASFASWEGEPPGNARDYETGWCPRCAHYVRREIGEGDWSAFTATEQSEAERA
jgi:hypothetical protein